MHGKETANWFLIKDLNSLVTRADEQGSADEYAAPPETSVYRGL